MTPTHPHDAAPDPELHRLLHDSVDDVHPDLGLDAILRRTETPSDQRSHWLPITAAAAFVTLLLIGGVAWLNRGHAPPVANPTGRDTTVSVYFLGRTAQGPRLFRESHQLSGITGSDLQAAVTDALAGAEDPDLRTGFPRGTRATVKDLGDSVEVQLTGDNLDQLPAGGSVAESKIAAQAIVWTVDAAVNRDDAPVSFVDPSGVPYTRLLGADTPVSVGPGAENDVLSPVSINLEEGAVLKTPIDITGKAASFEANVVWELMSGDKVVKSGFTTANECCTLSPYAFSLSAPPGRYTLVVHDDDASGMGKFTSDTKDIILE